MRSFLRTLCFGIVLAVAGNGVVMAAGAAVEPVVGTWQLNVAKSKFAGAAPKSAMRVYTESAAGITVKVTTVAANGTSSSEESTFKYDGKEYPYSGSSDFDSLSLTRKDANTIQSTQKKAGKVIGSTVRTVSADGKVLTLVSKRTGADGKPFSITQVFDRK